MQLQKTSTSGNLLIFKAPLPWSQSVFLNKSHTQTFLTLQSKRAREDELFLNNNSALRGRNSTKFWIIVIQMSSLFIHITNFKITITNLNSKILHLLSWYFLNTWVSNFFEERSSTISASSSYNLGMKNWNQ